MKINDDVIHRTLGKAFCVQGEGICRSQNGETENMLGQHLPTNC